MATIEQMMKYNKEYKNISRIYLKCLYNNTKDMNVSYTRGTILCIKYITDINTYTEYINNVRDSKVLFTANINKKDKYNVVLNTSAIFLSEYIRKDGKKILTLVCYYKEKR